MKMMSIEQFTESWNNLSARLKIIGIHGGTEIYATGFRSHKDDYLEFFMSYVPSGTTYLSQIEYLKDGGINE